MADMQGYFSNLMQDPMFNLGLQMMAQGKRGSLSGALSGYQGWQQGQSANQLHQLQLEQLKRQQEKAARDEALSAQIPGMFKPAVPGALEQGMLAPNLPAQSQQAQQLLEQEQGSPIADILSRINQSGNYPTQGSGQEMPLVGQPASVDIEGLRRIQSQLDPAGTMASVLKQAETAQQEVAKKAQWDAYIAGLPEDIRNNPVAMAVFGAPQEFAGKIAPGVLPSVFKPKEQKPVEYVQGREKFKIIPDMTAEQAQATGLRFIPGVGAIAKGELDKPIQVSVGGVGKPPSGYRYTTEGNLEPIPGGPAAAKVGITAEKEANKIASATKNADMVMGKVDEALGMIGPMTTGLVGDIRSTLPGRLTGSGAYTLEKTLDTIKARIGFDELQAMRDASPTGGALGQVAIQELAMLQATLGSLEKGQDSDVLEKNLNAIKQHYENWKNAVKQASSGGESPSVDITDRKSAYKEYIDAYKRAKTPELRKAVTDRARKLGVVR